MLKKLAFVIGDGTVAVSGGGKKGPVRTIEGGSEIKLPWLGIANGEEGQRKGSPHRNPPPIKKKKFHSMSSPKL